MTVSIQQTERKFRHLCRMIAGGDDDFRLDLPREVTRELVHRLVAFDFLIVGLHDCFVLLARVVLRARLLLRRRLKHARAADA